MHGRVGIDHCRDYVWLHGMDLLLDKKISSPLDNCLEVCIKNLSLVFKVYLSVCLWFWVGRILCDSVGQISLVSNDLRAWLFPVIEYIQVVKNE